jgi:diguanylate cyclase (GGDEF)-like protein
MKRTEETGKARVLVVDDDPDLLTVLELVLGRAGYEVATARSGGEGLAAIRTAPPGVCLVDFRLPDTSGLELIRDARAIDESIQFIAVTGQGSERVAVDLMKAGATDYLAKPFESEDIIAAVRRAFEARTVRGSRIYQDLARDLAEKNELLQRQMEEQSRRMSETTTLYEVARILTSKLDLADVLSTVMNLAGQLFQAQAFSIRLLDEEAAQLELVAQAGLSEEYCRRGPIPLGSSVAGMAALKGEPVHVPDVLTDERLVKSELARQEGLQSLLCLPLLIRERCIGVMTFYHKNTHHYSPEAERFLTTFASTVSIAVDNAKLYQEKARLAITDGLTGLYNHKHFHESLAIELGRARRYSYPVSLVLVDIDYFKRYNDAHGHQAGDALLRQLAGLFRKAARENDFVARYGGEEFAILLPQTDKPEALFLAERLCRTVERQRCDGEEVLPGGRLTISLGLASYPEDVDLAQDLVQRADQALYLAKSLGRNRVQCYQALH